MENRACIFLFNKNKPCLSICMAAVMLWHLSHCTPPTSSGSASKSLDPDALQGLVSYAGKHGTDALMIWKDDSLIGEWYFGKPPQRMELMSITKSIVALAIGRLITQGLLTLETPIYKIYPEWDQGMKKMITLRHILNHTSGLQLSPDEESTALYPDYVQRALAAEITHPPGETFVYNDKAVNLLAGIVERVSHCKLDVFASKEIFLPLGIVDVEWEHDTSGNPLVMSGLHMMPGDLAKIGKLLLNQGSVDGKEMIQADWIKMITRPGLRHDYGLLWWIVEDGKVFWTKKLADRWKHQGVSSKWYEPVGSFDGRHFESIFQMGKAVERSLGISQMPRWYAAMLDPYLAEARMQETYPVGYAAIGWLGQYVVVLPKYNLVAVRMRKIRFLNKMFASHISQNNMQEFPYLMLWLGQRFDDKHRHGSTADPWAGQRWGRGVGRGLHAYGCTAGSRLGG